MVVGSKVKCKVKGVEEVSEPHVLIRHTVQLCECLWLPPLSAGIERDSLYRALSVRGNPRLSTLVAVTKAVGLKLTVEAGQ